jgi:hypothetical protein
VEVCEEGTDNCAMTNAMGRSELDLPRCQEVTITMNKEGYAPYAIAGFVDEDFGIVAAAGSLFTDDQLSEIADQLGIEYPWNGGMVALAAFAQRAGTTFTHVGSTDGTAFYFDAANGQYSTALEATTAMSGLDDFPLGEGGFAELTPGEHQFEFGGAVGDCTPGRFAFAGDGPNRIRVPVLDGYIIWASMSCGAP